MSAWEVKVEWDEAMAFSAEIAIDPQRAISKSELELSLRGCNHRQAWLKDKLAAKREIPIHAWSIDERPRRIKLRRDKRCGNNRTNGQGDSRKRCLPNLDWSNNSNTGKAWKKGNKTKRFDAKGDHWNQQETEIKTIIKTKMPQEQGTETKE